MSKQRLLVSALFSLFFASAMLSLIASSSLVSANTYNVLGVYRIQLYAPIGPPSYDASSQTYSFDSRGGIIAFYRFGFNTPLSTTRTIAKVTRVDLHSLNLAVEASEMPTRWKNNYFMVKGAEFQIDASLAQTIYSVKRIRIPTEARGKVNVAVSGNAIIYGLGRSYLYPAEFDDGAGSKQSVLISSFVVLAGKPYAQKDAEKVFSDDANGGLTFSAPVEVRANSVSVEGTGAAVPAASETGAAASTPTKQSTGVKSVETAAYVTQSSALPSTATLETLEVSSPFSLKLAQGQCGGEIKGVASEGNDRFIRWSQPVKFEAVSQSGAIKTRLVVQASGVNVVNTKNVKKPALAGAQAFSQIKEVSAYSSALCSGIEFSKPSQSKLVFIDTVVLEKTSEVAGPAVIKASETAAGNACQLSEVTTNGGVTEVKSKTPSTLSVEKPSTQQGGGTPATQVENVGKVAIDSGDGAASVQAQANSLCEGLNVPAGATATLTSSAATAGVKFKSLNAKQSNDYASLQIVYELEKTPAPKATDSIQIRLKPALYDESQQIFDDLTALGGEFSSAADWEQKMVVAFGGAKVFYGAKANPSKNSLPTSSDSGMLYTRDGKYYTGGKNLKEFLVWNLQTNPASKEFLAPAAYTVSAYVNGGEEYQIWPVDLNAIKTVDAKGAPVYLEPAKLTQILVSSSKETRVGNYRFKVFLNNKNKLVMMHAQGSDSLKGEDLNNQRNLGEWKKFTDFGSGTESVWGYLTQPEDYKTRNEFVLTLYFGELESEPLAGKTGVLSDVLKDRWEACSPDTHPTKTDYVDYCVKYWKKATSKQLKYAASLAALRADCGKLFEFTEGVLSGVSKSTKNFNFEYAETPVGNCMPLASTSTIYDEHTTQLSCVQKYSSKDFVCAAIRQIPLKASCTALKDPLTECALAKKNGFETYCGSGVCKERALYAKPTKQEAECVMGFMGGSRDEAYFVFKNIQYSKSSSVKTSYSLVYLKASDGVKIDGSEQKTNAWFWTYSDGSTLLQDTNDVLDKSHFENGGSAVFEFRDSHDNVVYEAECELTSDQLNDVFKAHLNEALSIGTCEASLDMSKSSSDPTKWTLVVKYNPTNAFLQKTNVKPGDLKQVLARVDAGDHLINFWFNVASYKKDNEFLMFDCDGVSKCFVKPQKLVWSSYSSLASLKESLKKKAKPQRTSVTVYSILPDDNGKEYEFMYHFVARADCNLDLTKMPSNLKQP